MTQPGWHVAVLIPARNEELLIQRCLDSVLDAFTLLPASVTTDIVVVSDSCTDLTGKIANQVLAVSGIVTATEVAIVGHARALAASTALERYLGPRSRCWLANTDADCVVSKTWLLDQLSIADHGLEAIAGVITVDSFAEHARGTDVLFRDSYVIHADGSHPHVHGANLGVRADAYLRAGGWRDLETAEDHDLWSRLIGNATLISTARVHVSTSGRRVGRAPHGFADALAAHNEVAAF